MTKSLKATIIGTTAILGGISLITGGFAVWYFTKGKKTVRTDVITSGIKFNKPTDTTVGTFTTPDTNKYYLAIDQIARPTDGTSIPTTAGKGVNFVEGTAGVTTSDDYPTVAAKAFTVTWTAAKKTSSEAPYGVFYFPEDLSDYFNVYIDSTTASPIAALSDYQAAAAAAGVASGYVAYPLTFTYTSGASVPTYTYSFNLTLSYKAGMLPTTEEDYDILKNAAQDQPMGFAFGTLSASSVYTYSLSEDSKTAIITGFNGTPTEKDYATSKFANINGNILPVTGIGLRAFQYKNYIDNLTITSNVKSIDDGAFQNETNIKSVKVAEGLTSIGIDAFNGCTNLASLNIPTTVTSIGERAFANCTSLKAISLPEGLTVLGPTAFLNDTSLTTITIPSTIKNVPTGAFEGCSGLTSITLSNGVTSLDADAFTHCSSLTAVTIPGSMTDFNPGAFSYDNKITTLTISEGITKLTSSATFGFSTSLANVYLPSTLTSLESNAISNRKGTFTTIHFGGTKAAWKKLTSSSTIRSLTIICSNGKLTYDSNGKVS
jgi:hypothetical protein